IVAIDDSDQFAVGIQVVPLRAGRAQVVDRGFFARLAANRGNRGAVDKTGSMFENASEVRGDVDAQVGGHEIKDITAVARGAIRPQTGFVTTEHNFETVTGAAQEVAHQKLAAPDFASRQ